MPLGGFGARLGAWLLDSVLLWLGGVMLSSVLWTLGDLVLFMVWGGHVVYFAILDAEGRQTVGKRAAGVRVVTASSGEPISIGQGFGRALAKILSGIPFALGYLWAAWDPKRETWHDKLAGTAVVRAS